MAVTAKQIAQQLNLSEAAVSMALRGKPGVSTKTRQRVLEAARTLGYDLDRHPQPREGGSICFLFFDLYDKHAIFDSPFFTAMMNGVERALQGTGFRLIIQHVHSAEALPGQLQELQAAGCSGIILLGTEMGKEDFAPFAALSLPLVLLDVAFDTTNCNCVVINNVDGACTATEYLIRHTHSQPGYLRSSYFISNFDERADGFYKALRKNGLHTADSVVHSLAPSIDGAYADMLALLDQGVQPAKCYFADNDSIAIGAMRALKERGYRIPRDIAIVGFDNLTFSAYVDPPLTTMHVPSEYLGRLGVERLLALLSEPEHHPVKIAVSPTLLKRQSV